MTTSDGSGGDGVRSNAEDPNLFDGALSFNLSHGDILESWRRAKEGARVVVNRGDLGGNDSRELFEEEGEEEMVRPLPPSRQKVVFFIIKYVKSDYSTGREMKEIIIRFFQKLAERGDLKNK